MRDLIEVTRTWIANNDLDPSLLTVSDDGKQAQYKYDSSADGETYAAFLDLDIDKQWVEMFFYAPSPIPGKRRRAVAELVALINPIIHLGSLDILMLDGRVRFRCGVDMEGGELSDKMLDNMDAMACQYLDRYYPPIMATGFAGHSPERVFAEVTGEAPSDKPDPGWLATGDAPPEWDRFPGTRCLQNWATELATVITAGGDADAWELLGHGAVIEHDELERAQTLFHRIALDAGVQFAVVPEDAVLELPLGVVDPFRTMAPILVFLEPGAWMLKVKSEDANSESAKTIARFRERLIERLRAFDTGHPVVFATAAYDIGDLDESLRAVGVFDRRFAVASFPKDFVGADFMDQIGLDLCGESLTDAPGKVGKLVSGHDSNRKRGLAALAMKRLARREKRKVEFIDLVNFSTRGTIESDEAPLDAESVRKQVAYHEAGHALVAILDSGGRNIPEYATIVASKGFKGVVVESYAYFSTLDSQRTYRNLLHDTRIALAGRAGEQILVGSENVSYGASADLEGATRNAMDAFACYGFAPGMDDPLNAGSNLAVVYGEPSPSECEHVESLVRRFMADEYRNVLDLLTSHRPLLDAIAKRLMWDPVVDQSELAALCAEHQVVLENLTG